MVRRWTDSELLEGICEYLESLHRHEGLITPQEADQQVAVLENIRARVEGEIAWIRAHTAELSQEPTLGFPEINFSHPIGTVVLEPDEE